MTRFTRGYESMRVSPEGSLLKRVHVAVDHLLSQIVPTEDFLRSLPAKIASADLLYPSGLDPRLIRRRLRMVTLRRIEYHRLALGFASAWLPLTLPVLLLPLPNTLLYWQLFRMWSHWRCQQGAASLAASVEVTVVCEG